MTLDEAILHAEGIANKGCDQRAKDHRQLAEWLKELKRLRGGCVEEKEPLDARLCSIYNIKDGDILYYNINDDRWIFIFRDVNGIRNDMKKYHVLQYYAFCFEDIEDFVELKNSCVVDITKIKFANDEQKQMLFDTLEKCGYRWDAETKKIIKI